MLIYLVKLLTVYAISSLLYSYLFIVRLLSCFYRIIMVNKDYQFSAQVQFIALLGLFTLDHHVYAHTRVEIELSSQMCVMQQYSYIERGDCRCCLTVH